MAGRTGITRDSKKINIAKSYKGEKVADNHDLAHSEGTQHID